MSVATRRRLTGPAGHPVTAELSVGAVPRWRPLVAWLLAVPHYLVIGVLTNWLVPLGGLATFLAVVLTGRVPRRLFGAMVAMLRYQWRVATYLLWMRPAYPPFELSPVAVDPGGDPARLTVARPEGLRRLLPLVKWLLALPQLVLAPLVGLAAAVVAVGGFVAVLLNGCWPAGLLAFEVGTLRWWLKVEAYLLLLTDSYPPLLPSVS